MDDVGVSRDTAFRGMQPGAGFETGDFVKENLGGYRSKTTVVRRISLCVRHSIELPKRPPSQTLRIDYMCIFPLPYHASPELLCR